MLRVGTGEEILDKCWVFFAIKYVVSLLKFFVNIIIIFFFVEFGIFRGIMFLYRNEELDPKAATKEIFKIKDTLDFEMLKETRNLNLVFNYFYYLARFIPYLIYFTRHNGLRIVPFINYQDKMAFLDVINFSFIDHNFKLFNCS